MNWGSHSFMMGLLISVFVLCVGEGPSRKQVIPGRGLHEELLPREGPGLRKADMGETQNHLRMNTTGAGVTRSQ